MFVCCLPLQEEPEPEPEKPKKKKKRKKKPKPEVDEAIPKDLVVDADTAAISGVVNAQLADGEVIPTVDESPEKKLPEDIPDPKIDITKPTEHTNTPSIAQSSPSKVSVNMCFNLF